MFGVLFQKFICTTIRPTLLPYKEIYDYDSCAQFVADYVTFQVLDPVIDLVSEWGEGWGLGQDSERKWRWEEEREKNGLVGEKSKGMIKRKKGRLRISGRERKRREWKKGKKERRDGELVHKINSPKRFVYI